jgi:hypothetical protein
MELYVRSCVTVSIAAGQFEAARRALKDNAVPQVSKAPGFVKGFWAAGLDATSGLSLVVFKTKPDAENAANMTRSNPTHQAWRSAAWKSAR